MKLIIEEVKNSGLVPSIPREKDYHSKLFLGSKMPMLGSISPLDELEDLFPTFKGWKQTALDYGLPERQFNRNFDTYSCVVYSIAKATCYFLFKKYGIKTTISEMFNAFYANVVPNRGTSIYEGMESFRKYGWVSDKDYLFTTETTLAQFFSKPPKTIKIMAEGKLTEWDFHWEVVPARLDDIKKQYKKTPVVLTGYAWARSGDVFYGDIGRRANHAFLGLEVLDNGNNLIDDTYPFSGDKYREMVEKEDMFKELDSSYSYGSAHACWVTPTENNNSLSIKNIINMFKKISRDIFGGLWFIKKVNGKKHKQKIEGIQDLTGAIVDEVGVENNNLTNEQLSLIPDYKFFGK